MEENPFLLPNDLAKPGAVLTDREIRLALQRGFLLTGDYDETQIRQASYELRASGRVDELYHHDGMTDHRRRPTAERIRIAPGETVKIYCMEDLLIPTNVIAHVFALGPLFAVGLLGGSTYLDPGFRGEVFLAFSNISPVSVEVTPQDSIARLEFERLSESAENPHGGEQAVRDIEIGYVEDAENTDASDIEELRSRVTELEVVWKRLEEFVASLSDDRRRRPD